MLGEASGVTLRTVKQTFRRIRGMVEEMIHGQRFGGVELEPVLRAPCHLLVRIGQEFLAPNRWIMKGMLYASA